MLRLEIEAGEVSWIPFFGSSTCSEAGCQEGRDVGTKEHVRESKMEVEIVQEEEPEESPAGHKAAFPDPSPQTRDVQFQGRGRDKAWETWGPISASLGAMRPLVAKLDKLLLDPPQGCSSSNVKEEIHLLKKDVEELSSCLEELSEVEDPRPTAKCWMNEARDLSYKMEDYIDSLLFVPPADPSLVPHNITTARSFRKWFSFAKTPKEEDPIAAMVSEFRKYTREAIRGREVYVPSDSNTLRRRFVSLGPMLPTPQEYIVIDGQMNEFINSFAKNGDKQLNVVSILGSACLGKTTLARVLYNKLGKGYHCRAFIQVSRKPDMKRIFRDMLSQLQRQDPSKYLDELDLINGIKEYLQNKRYLIIIDDVWAATVWDIIYRALPEGGHGSRIITTTQIKDVALTCCCYQSKLVFEMKPLDDYHSRKLFFNRLFGSESYCPEQYKEVLNKIVEICGGLPLATISIAGLLGSQPAMTEDLLKHIHESLRSCFSASSTSERTREALNLSFNNLPHYLKTCLLYLCMYPQGYTFCTGQLAKQWMAEGFIDTKEVHDMKKVADSYLHQLIARRFIQPVHVNYNNEVLTCAVHDTVHDLIALKSVEENFIVAIDDSPTNVALSHKARRLSLLFGDAKYAKIPANIDKSQVRSVTYTGLFKCMSCITDYKFLRVLHLQAPSHDGQTNIVDPAGISELSLLRYLKIGCGISIIMQKQWGQCLETLDLADAGVINYSGDTSSLPPHLLHLALPLKIRLLNGIRILGDCLEDLHLTSSSIYRFSAREGMEVLGSLIRGHGNLRSIVIAAHWHAAKHSMANGYQLEMDDLVPPPLLQRFECPLASGIQFNRIPKWVKDLENLCILKITVTILEMGCVGILRGLRALTALSLYVGQQSTERIIFDKAGFSALKYFKLRYTSGIAWIKFEADAMPNLLKLRLVFNAVPRMDLQPSFSSSHYGRQEQYISGNALISIEHMPSLTEISAKFGGDADDVQYALRTFVSNHPSNPTINMPQVDRSSYGDESTKQKQQPYEIMEEEPYNKKYDKISERLRSSRLENKEKTFPHAYFSEMPLKPKPEPVQESESDMKPYKQSELFQKPAGAPFVHAPGG